MSRFDVIYPPKGEITFDGGTNAKYARALIAENQSPDNLNCIPDGNAIGTRGGTLKLNTAAVGSFAIDGLFTRHTRDGSESMVAWAGGTYWTLSGTSLATVPSGQSYWTAGVKASAVEYENHIFMGNGGTVPLKWNGTDLTRHGVYPPATAPSYSSLGAVSGATGTLTGTIYYKISYVNSAAVEGNPSTFSTGITVTSQSINLSDLSVAPQSYGVASRRLYRTKVGSGVSGTYYRVAEIGDNSTTTYADTVTDASLTVAAPSDNGVPPNWSTAIVHQDRIFCNDPSNLNYVWYSGVGEPYTFGGTDFLFFGDASGDLVRGFAVQDNTLLILCDKSVHAVYMPSADDADWVKLKTKSAYGSNSPRGAFRFGNKIGYPALENGQFMGFAAVQGTEATTSQTLLTTSDMRSDLISDPIEPDMLLVPETMAPRINAVVFEGKAYISLAYGAAQTTNNRIYVLDFTREALDTADKSELAWFPWSYSALAPGPMTVYNGNVYFGSDRADGFVYKINHSTISDDGTAINSYYTTKEFSGLPQDINTTKDFRRFDIMFVRTGSYYMNVGYRADSSSGSFTEQPVSVAQGGTLWGTGVWGVDSWSAGFQEGEETIFVPATRGKRIQFRFTNQNTIGQKFKIIRMKFAYNNKGRR